MTKWPKDDKLMQFDVLVAAVCKALKVAYVLAPKAFGENIPWIGPSLPKSMAHICLPFNDLLTREQLEYEESQGRTILEIIIGIAIKLGIEQGRRIALKDNYD